MNNHSIFLAHPPESLNGLPRKTSHSGKSASVKKTARRVKNSDWIESRSFQIDRAALELFESKGYTPTISDIAQLAGVASAPSTNTHPDKEGVLKMVLMDIMDAYAREIPRAIDGVADSLLVLRAALAAIAKWSPCATSCFIFYLNKVSLKPAAAQIFEFLLIRI